MTQISTSLFATAQDIEAFVRDFEVLRLPKPRWTHHGHLVACCTAARTSTVPGARFESGDCNSANQNLPTSANVTLAALESVNIRQNRVGVLAPGGGEPTAEAG